MMRKVLILVITLAMLASLGVAVMAEEPANPVLPGDDDFPAMIALEKAQVDTSQGLPEQALIENDCAEKRLAALERAQEQIGEDEFGHEVLEELIEYLNGNENNLGLIIAAMARDKENFDNAQTAEDVAKGIEERGWRLREIADEESNMPEGAKAGAQRALDNMERAAEKAAWARGEGEDSDNEGPPGPPPWAGKNEVDKDAKDVEIEVKPKGEETPAEDFLPEKKPVEEPPPVEAPPVEVPEGEDNDENGPPIEVPGRGFSNNRTSP